MTTNNEELLRRIRDLEQEVAEWKAQVSKQRYGLVWLEVPESFDKESRNRIPILEEDVELGFSLNDNQPTHILIEGDNYHSLTCLNYTHKNRVDVIYIDPPYNTGKDGFTYRDSRFLDERPNGEAIKGNHPMRHSTWLSFIAKRLRLAEQLLSDTGVIFISIDDNEQANLKLLCDNIFGEQNFIETYIWNSTLRPDNSSPLLRRNAEFILCYGKAGETFGELLLGGSGAEGFGMKPIREYTGEDIIIMDLMNDAAGYVSNPANFVLAGLQYNEYTGKFDSDTWCLISYGKGAATTFIGNFYKIFDSVR